MSDSHALLYSRRVFDATLSWYGNADTKAQVILTLDGAFLAFLTNAVFMDRAAFVEILDTFGPETWLLAAVLCMTLACSILSAAACLHSRLDADKAIHAMFEATGVDIGNAATYTPQSMLFFQPISRLDEHELAQALARVDENFEIRGLAHELLVLSKNVNAKHRWVNRGFACAGASLLLLLSVAVSYVSRLVG